MDYRPTGQDMKVFQDRSAHFAPTSHKGRTARERGKNLNRMSRVVERSRYDAEHQGKNTWKPIYVK